MHICKSSLIGLPDANIAHYSFAQHGRQSNNDENESDYVTHDFKSLLSLLENVTSLITSYMVLSSYISDFTCHDDSYPAQGTLASPLLLSLSGPKSPSFKAFFPFCSFWKIQMSTWFPSSLSAIPCLNGTFSVRPYQTTLIKRPMTTHPEPSTLYYYSRLVCSIAFIKTQPINQTYIYDCCCLLYIWTF